MDLSKYSNIKSGVFRCGHPGVEENIYVSPKRGYAFCRICLRIKSEREKRKRLSQGTMG